MQDSNPDIKKIFIGFIISLTFYKIQKLIFLSIFPLNTLYSGLSMHGNAFLADVDSN